MLPHFSIVVQFNMAEKESPACVAGLWSSHRCRCSFSSPALVFTCSELYSCCWLTSRRCESSTEMAVTTEVGCCHLVVIRLLRVSLRPPLG